MADHVHKSLLQVGEAGRVPVLGAWAVWNPSQVSEVEYSNDDRTASNRSRKP